jgi:hypothetical protein
MQKLSSALIIALTPNIHTGGSDNGSNSHSGNGGGGRSGGKDGVAARVEWWRGWSGGEGVVVKTMFEEVEFMNIEMMEKGVHMEIGIAVVEVTLVVVRVGKTAQASNMRDMNGAHVWYCSGKR